MLALPPPSNEHPGGQGDRVSHATLLPSFPSHERPQDFSRSDVRMFDQALKGFFPMSEEQRAYVVQSLFSIATAPDWMEVDHRAKVSASKALIDAAKLNVEVETAASKTPDVTIELAADGTERKRIDFSRMSDAELDAYLESGGRV